MGLSLQNDNLERKHTRNVSADVIPRVAKFSLKSLSLYSDLNVHSEFCMTD